MPLPWGTGTGSNAEASFAGRPESFDVEGNELAGTQTSTLIGVMVIFRFLAPGTYDTSLKQIKSQGVWQIGYSQAREPYI